MEVKEELLINEYYTRLVTTQSRMVKGESIVEPYKVISQKKTSSFLQDHFLNSTPNILPRNCRYFSDNTDGRFFILEDEPTIRTISVDVDLLHILERHKINGKFEEFGLENFNINKRPYRFVLSFPYIVYFIQLSKTNKLSSLSLFFRLQPLTSFNDYLISASLPNIQMGGGVCLGRTQISDGLTEIETVSEVITSFWSNRFNNDYYPHYYEEVPEVCDYFTWQHQTKLDPLFIFSTKWIMSKNTVGDIVKDYSSDFHNYGSDFLVTMFKNSTSSQKDNSGNQKNRSLTQSISLPNGIIISIGDEIIKDDKKYYVYSFISQSKYGKIECVELEDENGNISIVNISDKEMKALSQNFKKDEIESILINGVSYKKGDLLVLKETEQIKSIKKIIKTRDNSIQLRIGKEFYVGNALNKFEFFDKENLKLNGVKLQKNENYIILQHQYSDGILIRYFIGKFKDIEQNDDEETSFIFETSNKITYNVQSNERSCSIVDPKTMIQNPRFYRINERLFVNNGTICILKNIGIGVSVQDKGFNEHLSLYNFKSINLYRKAEYADFLSSIKDEIYIPGFDFDINYKINDEVIYIDWTNPNGMFEIKRIHSFSFNSEQNVFNFNLINDLGNIQSVPFITLRDNDAIIESGKIRKVCRELNNVTVGTKVIANLSGITDFPKKNCNEIKAFVIDCDPPLILFSNYRTLPVNSLENFNLYSKNHSKYSKLIVCEDNSKIKIQDRDMVKDGTITCMVSRSGGKYRLSVIDPTTNYRYRTMPSNVDLRNRYGLLLPRHSDVILNTLPTKCGSPGSRSNIIINSNYNYGVFVRDTDSIIN